MPGWHKKTKDLMAAGKLNVAGIVQEQHPDRASLYMQWQQMDWPVLADPFNDLGISAVPITLLVDEYGIIRFKNPKLDDLKTFLNTSYSNKGKKQSVRELSKDIDELVKLTSDKKLTSNQAARAHFRLGVAYRMRFDSSRPKVEDFQHALEHWQKALELTPSQYIWRRRIQQYGPRLDKPYSFYDWVMRAREDILKRGENPIPLGAEPSGAEFAVPSKANEKAFANKNLLQEHPDPQNRLPLDAQSLVSNSVVIVPSTNKKQSAVRVYLTLQLAEQTSWTNDAGNVSFHLDPDSDAKIKDLKIPVLPSKENSSESRVIEFELHPKKGKTLPKEIHGSVFYYVCTKTDHTCQFLRQNIKTELKVVSQ